MATGLENLAPGNERHGFSSDKAQILVYQTDDFSTMLEVRVEEETVWLTQTQMVELFNSTKQNISLHINKIYKEGELKSDATVKEYLIVQMEGRRQIKRKVAVYNLDVIISVGYRVKSQRGTQFRIWANQVLREYLLKGYAINQRIDKIEGKLLEHDQKFDLLIKTNLPPNEGIFYDGQIFDAHLFVSGLIKSAEKSLVGSRQSAVGSRQSAVSSQQSAVGSRQSAGP